VDNLFESLGRNVAQFGAEAGPYVEFLQQQRLKAQDEDANRAIRRADIMLQMRRQAHGEKQDERNYALNLAQYNLDAVKAGRTTSANPPNTIEALVAQALASGDTKQADFLTGFAAKLADAKREDKPTDPKGGYVPFGLAEGQTLLDKENEQRAGYMRLPLASRSEPATVDAEGYEVPGPPIPYENVFGITPYEQILKGKLRSPILASRDPRLGTEQAVDSIVQAIVKADPRLAGPDTKGALQGITQQVKAIKGQDDVPPNDGSMTDVEYKQFVEDWVSGRVRF
jgi:hypothetical protein